MSRRIAWRALVAIGVAVIAMSGSAVAAAALRPTISSVTFSGLAGPGQPSPTITVQGRRFGPAAPIGQDNNVTSCGTYTNNGEVFKGRFYFTDDTNFEAGYSNATGADCIGIIIQSWTATKVVFTFGNSYGSFDHWYLSNGDGFAISLKTALFGGTVSGLT